jgi:exodeoxyribonuclease V alpha subunit
VFNGDIGRLVQVGVSRLMVEFDGRRVPWPKADLGDLELAYAITVHKSQGSEYPAVVLAFHSCHHVMLRRNLFYTALTRARSFFCMVGAPAAWSRAVGRTDDHRRHTALADRVAEQRAYGNEADQ